MITEILKKKGLFIKTGYNDETIKVYRLDDCVFELDGQLMAGMNKKEIDEYVIRLIATV